MRFFGKRTLIFFMAALSAGVSIGYAAETPQVTAKSAVVVEAATGAVIYARDAETRRYPASTTKMMTLILALEKGKLDDIVTASRTASETEGSSLWLEAGERQRLEDLLYGIMLISGNDATVAVAEHIAGSVESFAALMTQKAHEIGAQNTSFVNSSGLPDPRHYSTAHDLAKIAAYGYRNPLFARIIGTKEKIIPWAGKEYGRDLGNENKLLWLYEGGNGVKTGYTEAAGHCLVAGAKRGGVQLIAVVLDSEAMWKDAMALLDYGFARVALEPVLQKDAPLKTIRVASGYQDEVILTADAELAVPLIGGERGPLTTEIDAPEEVRAPVAAGQKLGTVRVLYEGAEVASADLVAAASVERKSFFAAVYQTIASGFQYFWQWVGQQR